MGTAHLYIDDSAIESGRRSGRLTFADGSALTLWYEAEGVALSAAAWGRSLCAGYLAAVDEARRDAFTSTGR